MICNCKKKKETSGVLRFNVPKNLNLSFNDLIFGNLEVNTNNIENFALLRSDKSPTYMLAVVVDDFEMDISHVIRGEDHKTNTFKQILLYKAFNKKIPIFAHLPLNLGEDGKKLSKRNGNTSVNYYLEKGYVPDALFNIVLKLGWGFANEEIISRDKIVEIFEFKDVKKSAAKFDEKKLLSFSGKYLRNHDYSKEINDYFLEYFHCQTDLISKLYEEVSKRSNTFNDFYSNLDFMFKSNDFKISKELFDAISCIDHWTKEEILKNIKDFCSKNNQDFKNVSKQYRLKLTGKEHSIDIFKLMEVYGKEKTLSLLQF
ncbi:MAG: glutamate--tRNA ligase [Bacteroidota bacterium]